jgi:hypothetical protein
VLNSERRPRAEYLMLHLATCWTINGRPSRGRVWTTGGYRKVCVEPVCY